MATQELIFSTKVKIFTGATILFAVVGEDANEAKKDLATVINADTGMAFGSFRMGDMKILPVEAVAAMHPIQKFDFNGKHHAWMVRT